MPEDFPIQNESELREYFDHHDPLTYAANRRGLQEEFLRIQQGKYGIGESHALFFVDLDHFKEANDLYGFWGGDQILIEAAERLRSVIHPGGTVGRIGGDQFACLIPTIGIAIDVKVFAERVLDRFKTPFPIDLPTESIEVKQLASLGVVVWNSSTVELNTLMGDANRAQIEARIRGDGQCVIRELDEGH